MSRFSPLPWNPAEDAILIHRHEGDNLTSTAIPDELHSRSEIACVQRYTRLSGQDLTPGQLSDLGRLWIANKDHMFAQVTGACGLTSSDYVRIAFRSANSISQRRKDDVEGHSAAVVSSYKQNNAALWRSLTKQMVGVTWAQAEWAWMGARGLFVHQDL